MERLVDNAFLYLDPDHGIFDPVSGYPVEGWNQDRDQGLYLRDFTQITAIGLYLEVLANVVAGQAGRPVAAREQALTDLQKVVATLRADQKDPSLGSGGLLVNFLGLEGDRRVGPLAQVVKREDVDAEFGAEEGERLWKALAGAGWIAEQNRGREGAIHRGESYGAGNFTGPLAPWADARQRVMGLLDRRVVLVAYGDNANLTLSVAKAIGALLHPSVRDRAEVRELRGELDAFIDAQEAGYRGLIDAGSGMFSFGRDESTGRFFGWNTVDGDWVVGHQDYLGNEFRDPTLFIVLIGPAAIRYTEGFGG